MDMKSKHSSPVLTDSVTVNKSRIALTSNLLQYSAQGASHSSSGLCVSVPRRKPFSSKFDDGHDGWLDAMQSSSPPRKKLNKDYTYASDEADAAYRTWAMNYPSALTSFDHIAKHAKGKKIALFMDYDGTLSPIVEDPERAFMSSAMRYAVKNVAKYFPTAIISGRSRDKVCEFVGLTELYYAGSHGMDIMGPIRDSGSSNSDSHPNCIRSADKQDKEVNLFQPASEFLPVIEEVFKSLIESTNVIKGAKVENNKFCVSVHYRNVDEKNWPLVAQIVLDVLKGYPRLRLTHGRKVLEIRPVIDWNKGKAVQFLLESLGLCHRDDVLSIYVGDDRSDEDAFKVLRDGKLGFGILVSSVPKETNASYSLRDPSEVMDFLKSLVKWKKTGGNAETASSTSTVLNTLV